MRGKGGLERQLQDPEYRRIYQQEKLILDVTDVILRGMARRDLTKADLARSLGRTRGFMTQILSGSRNLTLRTWADAMTVLGFQARVDLEALPAFEGVQTMWSVNPVSEIPGTWQSSPVAIAPSCQDAVAAEERGLAA